MYWLLVLVCSVPTLAAAQRSDLLATNEHDEELGK